MTVQKEVRAVPVLLGARLPLSDLWFWEHQLQPSLEVESELRFVRSEPRIPSRSVIGWAWFTSQPMRALGKHV